MVKNNTTSQYQYQEENVIICKLQKLQIIPESTSLTKTMTNPVYSTAKMFVCAEDPDGLRIKISSSVFWFWAVPLQKVSAWPQRSKQSTIRVWSVNHDTFVIWLRQYQKGHKSDRSQQTAWKTQTLQLTHIPRGHYEQLRSMPRH